MRHIVSSTSVSYLQPRVAPLRSPIWAVNVLYTRPTLTDLRQESKQPLDCPWRRVPQIHLWSTMSQLHGRLSEYHAPLNTTSLFDHITV